MPTIAEELKQLAADGKLKSAWSKFKTMTDKGSDPAEKAELQKLYKEFNSNLSGNIGKFEKATTFADARKYADKACVICDDYAKKVAKAKLNDKKTETALFEALRGLREIFANHIKELVKLGQGVGKLNMLTSDGKLKYVWKNVKKLAMAAADKEDKATLTKLYDSFDKGLTPLLDKYQKADTVEEALKLAEQGKKIAQDYHNKIEKTDFNDVPKVYGPLETMAENLVEYFTQHISELKRI